MFVRIFEFSSRSGGPGGIHTQTGSNPDFELLSSSNLPRATMTEGSIGPRSGETNRPEPEAAK